MRRYPSRLLIALLSAGTWSAPLAAQSSSAGDAPKPEAVLLNGASPIAAALLLALAAWRARRRRARSSKSVP